MPLKEVLMQIKDEPSLKWLEKMKGNPNKHNRNKYCHFHRDHGHDTDEYFDLKQQIENLIRQGKLRNFLGQDHKDEKLKGKVEESSRPPLGEIRIILGGSSTGQSSKLKKAYLKVVQNIQLSGRSPRARTTDYVLADEVRTRPAPTNELPPVGFGGMKVQPVGIISLLVTVGAYPQQVTKEVNFLVVDCLSSYNAIIGRLILNSWKAVTSTYHLWVKFPTEQGVGQVQGDQLAARECYLAMLAMDEQIQAMNIEEKRVVVEPAEVLEDDSLDETYPKRCTRIGADLEDKIKEDLI
ncbi:uncharacterized protein LOC136069713 [Quercus suber]|uniref:uncharacterized protein LOC136069713 n=1 Tax=Quercus suber TaxID=58331 RepID=UPI0032DF5D62